MAIFGGLNTLRKERQFSDRLDQAIPQQPMFPVGLQGPMSGSGGASNMGNSRVVPGAIMTDGQRANPGPDALMKMARPAPDQRKGGGGLRRFFENFRDDILPRLTAAGAIANGDYGAAAQIQSAYMRQAAERQESQAAAEQFQRLASGVASLPGMDLRQYMTFLGNPEQWAANMSDAISTHYAAANVGQTETRVFGNPNAGGDYYQPPRLIENGADTIRYDPRTGQTSTAFQGMTPGQQYARSLGLEPGSPGWNNAVRDAELGANGPTAFGYDQQLENLKQSGRMGLEQEKQQGRSATETLRQQGRQSIEETRQRNRIITRRTPAARSERVRSGGGAGGVVQVRSVEEANRLPRGTLYRTPSGEVRRR